MRLILGDRLLGGVIAAFVAYGMLLHGVFGALAQAAMVGTTAGPDVVICSPLGTATAAKTDLDDRSQSSVAHDFCAALCQAACSQGSALPSNDLGPAFASDIATAPCSTAQDGLAHLSALGLLAEARAPPQRSI